MRTRQSICSKKARFASEADAEAAAARSRLLLLPYLCDRCRAFHLTSRTKGKRLARPDVTSGVGYLESAGGEARG
jgi:hypothetical protein